MIQSLQQYERRAMGTAEALSSVKVETVRKRRGYPLCGVLPVLTPLGPSRESSPRRHELSTGESTLVNSSQPSGLVDVLKEDVRFIRGE